MAQKTVWTWRDLRGVDPVRVELARQTARRAAIALLGRTLTTGEDDREAMTPREREQARTQARWLARMVEELADLGEEVERGRWARAVEEIQRAALERRRR